MSDLHNSIAIVRRSLSFLKPLVKLESDLVNLIEFERGKENIKATTDALLEKNATLKEQNKSLESQLITRRETVREEIDRIDKRIEEEKIKSINSWDGQISKKHGTLELVQKEVNKASSRLKNLETEEKNLQIKVDKLRSVVKKTETLVE